MELCHESWNSYHAEFNCWILELLRADCRVEIQNIILNKGWNAIAWQRPNACFHASGGPLYLYSWIQLNCYCVVILLTFPSNAVIDFLYVRLVQVTQDLRRTIKQLFLASLKCMHNTMETYWIMQLSHERIYSNNH